MEQQLIQARPASDTLALLLLVFPLVKWLVSDVPPRFAYSLELALLLPALLICFRAVAQPLQPAAESKSVKRTTRQRTPLMWAVLVRIYLSLIGDTPLKQASTNHPATSTEVLPLTPLKSSPSSDSAGKQDIPTLNGSQILLSVPLIRYVYSTLVGVQLPQAAQLLYFINSIPWTQVFIAEDASTATFFGLLPNTIYEVRALDIHSKRVMTEFIICTSPSHVDCSSSLDDNARPRKRVPVYDEALSSISDLLNECKAKSRKVRKERLKKLTGLRNEIDGMSTKLLTKRKADERYRKRIKALQDRVHQQKEELQQLERTHASQVSSEEVLHLAHEVDRIQKERQCKQSGLDVSVRVWEELQRSKRNEIEKLNQRCTKLHDRLEKAKQEIIAHQQSKAKAVTDYIQMLKVDRNNRKQRRVRLETDFKSAIAKLAIAS